MKNLNDMLNAAIENDKDSFVDFFVREAVSRINKSIDEKKIEVSKNILQPEGVWNEVEEVSENEELSDVLESRINILSSIRRHGFGDVNEAKSIRRKLNLAGLKEGVVSQKGDRLFLENINTIEQASLIYSVLKEETIDLYDPFFEFSKVIQEAIKNDEASFTLADSSEVIINSKLARQISQVHDTLTRENQQIFKNNISLNESSFNNMIDFVKETIENIENEEETE